MMLVTRTQIEQKKQKKKKEKEIRTMNHYPSNG